MEIAASTVGELVQILLDLWSYNANIGELRARVEKLQDARDDIRGLVASEKGSGKQILNAVQNWLKNVDEITRDSRQLCEDPRLEKVGCSKCSFPNLWLMYKLSRKVRKAAINVADLLEKGKFDRIGYERVIDRAGFTFASRRFIDFQSRMPIMNEITQALADHKVSILGIYGLGGIGKNFLVERVAANALQDNLFNKVVKALVTQSPDHARIQGDIADQLGLEFNEETVSGRANKLRERINRMKNVLIILDDVWAPIKLEEIGIPYMGKFNLEEGEITSGEYHLVCKVLLTSRNRDVLNEMGTQKDFGLDFLREQETWCLFEVMAGDIVGINCCAVYQ